MALTAKLFESIQTPSCVTLFQDTYRVGSARLADWDYRSRGWYFVTICTKGRQYLLGHIADGAVALTPAGTIAEREMKGIPGHYPNITIDRFVVMPNHVHAIVVIEGQHLYTPNPVLPALPKAMLSPGPQSGSLSAVVRGYKSGVSRICRADGILGFEWQPRFHDHLLRSNAAVIAVRDYIERNPENWHEDPDNPEVPQTT